MNALYVIAVQNVFSTVPAARQQETIEMRSRFYLRSRYYWIISDALSFQFFEPESWKDYAVIPYHLARWVFAYIWTRLWGFCRLLRHGRKPWVWMWGRWVSPEPMMCPRCLWAGPTRWLVHTYESCGDEGDCEAVDECPKCGYAV